ncbi:MAG TPA: ELWxxDGT repeat protein [Thermoanaerobaculia bacterium]|nr:ELWxxDGT repeat protein [Thermoanaerobaculia bacterium]
MRTKSLALAVLIFSSILLSAAWAQPAFMVKNIGDTVSSGSPLDFHTGSVALDGVLYFFSDDGVHGAEPWRTDGTTAGTRMVRDLCPGTCSSYLVARQSLTPFQHKVYWYGSDGAHNVLMASDGTPQGTGPVLGPASPAASHFLAPLGVAGGRLLLSGISEELQGELWATDGTEEGTVRLRIFRSSKYFSNPALVGQVGGLLVFGIGSELDPQGETLWATDGTAGGTLPLTTGSQGMGFGSAILAGGRLFFDSFSPSGDAGWVSDGTPAGTQALPGISFDRGLTAVGSQVFFVRPNATGWELWRSDGTPDGTALVKAFTTYLPFEMAAVGNRLFLNVGDALWVSDGTADGTLQVRQPLAPSGFLAFGGRLAFFAFGETSGLSPWISDGTADGTYPVAELPRLSPLVGSSSDAHTLGILSGRWLFAAADSQGWFLWSSDGTPGSLTRIRRLNVQTSSFPQPEADLDGTLLFSASAANGQGLWRTDGSVAGTVELAATSFNLPHVLPAPLGWIGGRLFFASDVVPSGTGGSSRPLYSLWVTDGTADGTRQVTDTFPLELDSIAVAQIGGSLYLLGTSPKRTGLFKTDGTSAGTAFLHPFDPQTEPLQQLLAVGDRLFFLAGAGNSSSLWTSDGTVAGTKPVVPGHPFQSPVFWAAVGPRLLFTVRGAAGGEIWTSDGTAAGTYRIAGIGIPGTASLPAGLGGTPAPTLQPVAAGRVFFVSDDGVHGAELWTTDGTAAGTHGIATIAPEGARPGIGLFTVVGRRVFFVANDGTQGSELWTSDGTAAGTYIVVVIASGRAGSPISSLTAVGRRVFFTADDGAHGRELWTSDGTAAGTHRVADIVPGAGSSLPANLTAVDGRLLFAADDGVHGVEPWVSDGTAAGTRMLQDIAPGGLPSSPSSFFVSGGYVYFSANDAAHGFELWAVPRSALRAHP